jgi:uncharacterized protein (UPF0335 family)
MTETATIDPTILKSFIERIEFVEERKTAINEDLKEIYSEAKNAGLPPTPLKAVIKLRKIEASKSQKQKHDEDQYWFDTFKTALNID